jgi:hypothetical protein
LQTYGRNVNVAASADEVTIVDGVDVLIDKLDDSAAVELIRPNPLPLRMLLLLLDAVVLVM